METRFFHKHNALILSGWICYAEKTHGEFILPYISTTRSPQQMMGSLVKGYFAEQQVRVALPPSGEQRYYSVLVFYLFI